MSQIMSRGEDQSLSLPQCVGYFLLIHRGRYLVRQKEQGNIGPLTSFRRSKDENSILQRLIPTLILDILHHHIAYSTRVHIQTLSPSLISVAKDCDFSVLRQSKVCILVVVEPDRFSPP